MKSPTHYLIGHCCARLLQWRGRDARLLILGACLPDLPIILCWPAIGIYIVITGGSFELAQFRSLADRLYFSDSVLSALHNLMHSPVSLAFLLLCVGILFPTNAVWRRACVIVLAGAVSHSLLDIVSHVEDGPLVLWPLEDTIRFRGPISHWNPAHGGMWVSVLEIGGVIAFAIWRAFRRLRRARFFPASRFSTRYDQRENNAADEIRSPGDVAGWTETASP